MLDHHTRRLEEMTNDLLCLHKIETAKQQLRLEKMEAGSLVEWAREQFSKQAKEGAVALDILAENPSDTFTTDLTLLQLIVQNLIDNAIKFPQRDRVFRSWGGEWDLREYFIGRGSPGSRY